MRGSFHRLAVLGLMLLTAGCATAVDLDSVNRRIDDNATRIAAVEKAQAQRDARKTSEAEQKIQALESELETLRKELADSNWSMKTLTEKVEAFGAYMEEMEQFMTQFRKKGGEMDKALEALTNRLEADVRSLADKLKKMLEEDRQ